MRKAKLLRPKNATGWDAKGEVAESVDKNLEDTATPVTQHRTNVNMMNVIRDSDAEREFPELGNHLHRYPGRGRG